MNEINLQQALVITWEFLQAEIDGLSNWKYLV